MLIDDFAADDAVSRLGTRWDLVTDRVMGGISTGNLERTRVRGRRCQCLGGTVSLENQGGFVQMALALDPDGGTLDLSGYRAIALTVRGDGRDYDFRLRTSDLTRPWQSFRAAFPTTDDWKTVEVALDGLEPRKTDARLNLAKARRLGLLAIGAAMRPDLCVAEMRLIPK